MRINLIILAVLFSRPILAATGLEDEIACHHALLYKAEGSENPRSFELDDGTVVVPGMRDGRRSLFVYSQDSVQQYWIPATPSQQDNFGANYNATFQLPGRPLSNVSFRIENHPSEFSITGGSFIRPGSEVTALRGGDWLNDESRLVIRNQLRSRVDNVFAQYSQWLRESLAPPNSPMGFPTPDIEDYKTALQSCMAVEEISDLVTAELQKFTDYERRQNGPRETSRGGAEARSN
jgi:hypothetical protein